MLESPAQVSGGHNPRLAGLKEAMLQYAYDLMWDGHCAAVDAITEFLPSDDVNAMFDAWEQDQTGDGPKSRWYGNG